MALWALHGIQPSVQPLVECEDCHSDTMCRRVSDTWFFAEVCKAREASLLTGSIQAFFHPLSFWEEE